MTLSVSVDAGTPSAGEGRRRRSDLVLLGLGKGGSRQLSGLLGIYSLGDGQAGDGILPLHVAFHQLVTLV